MTAWVLAEGTASVDSQLAQTLILLGIASAVCIPYLAGVGRLIDASSAPWWAWRSFAWRRYAFCTGVLVAVLAVLPKFDPIVDASFVLHMSQHLVLMFVAAPLLGLGAPGLPLLLSLPRRGRRPVAIARAWAPVRQLRRFLTLPIVAVVFYFGVIVIWHLPAVFTAALENDTIHELEHASFLFAAWWLWAPLTAPHRQLKGGVAVLYMFVSGFPMIGVGAGLTMAPRPLYPAQTGTGPGALHAQQLAGVLMWVPSTFLTLIVATMFVASWLRGLERATPADAPLPPAIPPPLPVGDGPVSRSGPRVGWRRSG